MRSRELTLDQAKRMWPRLYTRLSVGGLNECWEWHGAKAGGYGQIALDGKLYQVHRVVWTRTRAVIPDGLTIDHLCRNRACANPRHLEVVPMRENTLRGVGPTAVNAHKTHCKRGHAFTPENIYTRPTGQRECLICKKTVHAAGRGYVPVGERES